MMSRGTFTCEDSVRGDRDVGIHMALTTGQLVGGNLPIQSLINSVTTSEFPYLQVLILPRKERKGEV